MKSEELVGKGSNLPYRISIIRHEDHNYHFHRELELSFVLKGSFICYVKNNKYKLNEKNLFLINCFDLHSFIPEEEQSILLVMHIDPTFFEVIIPNFLNHYYDFEKLYYNKNDTVYLSMVSNLAEIVLSFIKSEHEYRYIAIKSIIEILLILYQNLRLERRSKPLPDSEKYEKIKEVLEYLDQNYYKDINLTEISKEFFVSPQYFSKLFKDLTGIGFKDYINRLRINKSLKDLINTKKSITSIAISYGFSSVKTYNRIFRKIIGVSPTVYRKNSFENEESHLKEYNFFDIDYNNNFKSLFEFLEDKDNIGRKFAEHEFLNLNLNLQSIEGEILTKNWNVVINIGRASLCLRDEVIKQIKLAKEELGYKYVRFHGIFSDELLVYREDSKGKPIFNWIYTDQIIDSLLKKGIKPFIVLDFMPEKLASKNQYAPYIWKANISYPKSIANWNLLVTEFIKHCLKRYSEEEVKEWFFEIWSPPELKNIFWSEDDEKFYEFFKETYFSIKGIFSKAKIGTPGVLPFNSYKWLFRFLDFCKNNFIKLDFISTYIFPYTDKRVEALPKQFYKISNNEEIFSIADKDYLFNVLVDLKNKLRDNNYNLPIFVTEWSLSPFISDYNRDSCFMAIYVIYNIIRNIGNADIIAFWNLSDILDENYIENFVFNGGHGLFTYNGIKKPSYNAFWLLNKLGNKILYIGNNYIVTKDQNSYQILLFNFTYFDELFKSGDRSLLNMRERYNIFEPAKERNVTLKISIEPGIYKIKKFYLNRNSGSTFDAWVNLGAPEEIDKEVFLYLKSKEIMNINVAYEKLEGQLILSEVIPPHGALLVEIHKIFD